ncbi:hypothetical protein ACN47E_003175 [Coniothyrium glycines]
MPREFSVQPSSRRKDRTSWDAHPSSSQATQQDTDVASLNHTGAGVKDGGSSAAGKLTGESDGGGSFWNGGITMTGVVVGVMAVILGTMAFSRDYGSHSEYTSGPAVWHGRSERAAVADFSLTSEQRAVHKAKQDAIARLLQGPGYEDAAWSDDE